MLTRTVCLTGLSRFLLSSCITSQYCRVVMRKNRTRKINPNQNNLKMKKRIQSVLIPAVLSSLVFLTQSCNVESDVNEFKNTL
jgi:hypothetical protein